MATFTLFKLRWIIIIIMILALIHWGGNFLNDFDVLLGVYQFFGLSLSGFLDGGIWSVFTYAFLHKDWFHLSINTLFFVFVGARLNQVLGGRLWWSIVIMGVVCGGLFHLITSVIYLHQGGGERHLIGMSGACYSLLLAFTTLWGDRRLGFLPLRAKNLALGAVISQVFLLLMSPALALPGFSQMGEALVMMGAGDLFRSSFSCHLGGAFAGWLIVSIHIRKNLR